MKFNKIARTDLNCSFIGLGGVGLGSKIDQENAFRLMDIFAEHGGNMVDTAQVYDNWLPIEMSISEKTIGRWMKSRKNRDQFIVTTKGAHPHLETMHIPRLSPLDILHDINGSLQNLQVETIDLYWLHRDDTTRPVAEIIELLNDQIKVGKIRYFGCSNWSLARIKEAQRYAEDHHIQGFSGNQLMWSLAVADRIHLNDQSIVMIDEETKQYHRSTGLAAFAYSSLAQGLFSKWDSGVYSVNSDMVNPVYRSIENRKRFERLRQLSLELSLSVSQVALGYIISQPSLSIPIVGCYTPKQLEECLQAEEAQLTQEQLNFLEIGTEWN
jgi:aryl-alcohol dehydrogenase-like predicted oxidoreductase